MSRWAAALCLAVLALWSVAWVVNATRHGLAGGDSASYLGMASDLRAGHGPTTPFLEMWDAYAPKAFYDSGGHVASTHFPPGYPVGIALASVVTRHVSSAARLVGVLLLPVNLVLVALLTARMTGFRSRLLPLVPPLLLVLLPDTRALAYNYEGWLASHATAASEPLFTALLAGVLLVLARYARDDRPSWRVLTSVIVLGAACVATRWLGVAVVGTIFLALLVVDRHGGVRVRLARATWAALASLGPVLVFLVWGALSGGGSNGGQGLVYHPLGNDFTLLVRIFAVFASGDIGSPLTRETVLFVLALAVAVLVGLSFTRGGSCWRSDREGMALIVIATFAIVVFAATVVLTRLLLEAAIPIDARILMPVRGLFYAVVVAVIYRTVADLAPGRWAVTAVTLLALSGIVLAWRPQREFLAHWQQRAPTPTPMELALRRLGPRTVVASDTAGLVYRGTGLHVTTMPSRIGDVSLRRNGRYRAESRELAALLRARGGFVLWDAKFYDPLGDLTPRDLAMLVPLRTVASSGTQTLYEVVSPPVR